MNHPNLAATAPHARIDAAGMAAALVLFSLTGDTSVGYLAGLFGVPLVSGVLAGRGDIRFWQAAAGCLSVVAVDLAYDETRVEDAIYFAGLGVVMVGLAALARWVTRLGCADSQAAPRPDSPPTAHTPLSEARGSDPPECCARAVLTTASTTASRD